MDENRIANRVIGAAIEVHRALGPGLLESAYRDCLRYEISFMGMHCEAEVPISISYKGLVIGNAYRADLLIENCLMVELKCVERMNEIHRTQLLTYLRWSKRKLGLLINFNTLLLKSGIQRVVNNL